MKLKARDDYISLAQKLTQYFVSQVAIGYLQEVNTPNQEKSQWLTSLKPQDIINID